MIGRWDFGMVVEGVKLLEVEDGGVGGHLYWSKINTPVLFYGFLVFHQIYWIGK